MTFVFAQAELLSVKSFLRQAIYVKNRLVNCKKKKCSPVCDGLFNRA